jgi:hypothetical protein
MSTVQPWINRTIVCALCSGLVFVAIAYGGRTNSSGQDVKKYGYELLVTRLPGDMDDHLEVRQGGQRVYELDNHSIQVEDNDSLGVPEDMNGDGFPELIVNTFSGGAHCCFADYILQLGPKFVVLDTINHPAGWKDLDGDNLPEVRVADHTFDYWKMSHAESAIPVVILKYQSGHYRPAPDLMRKSVPDALSVLQSAQQTRELGGWVDYDGKDFQAEGVVAITKTIVDMMYSGNPSLATQFLDAAWPANIGGKNRFFADFITQLRQSPYYVGMRSLFEDTTHSTIASKKVEATDAEQPTPAMHVVELYAVRISEEDFHLSSFGNPLKIKVTLLENGKEVMEPNGFNFGTFIGGTRGKRALRNPVTWRLQPDLKKRYQLVIEEQSVVATTSRWEIPRTPLAERWLFETHDSEIRIGKNSYFKFRDSRLPK